MPLIVAIFHGADIAAWWMLWSEMWLWLNCRNRNSENQTRAWGMGEVLRRSRSWDMKDEFCRRMGCLCASWKGWMVSVCWVMVSHKTQGFNNSVEIRILVKGSLQRIICIFHFIFTCVACQSRWLYIYYLYLIFIYKQLFFSDWDNFAIVSPFATLCFLQITLPMVSYHTYLFLLTWTNACHASMRVL